MAAGEVAAAVAVPLREAVCEEDAEELAEMLPLHEALRLRVAEPVALLLRVAEPVALLLRVAEPAELPLVDLLAVGLGLAVIEPEALALADGERV